MTRQQLCDWCHQREVLDYRFRMVGGYAAICGRCRRLAIPDPTSIPTAGDFCCVVDPELSTQQQETAGTDDDDARPQKEFTYE